MRTHRISPPSAQARNAQAPAGGATAWWWLLTALCFCGLASFILQLGNEDTTRGIMDSPVLPVTAFTSAPARPGSGSEVRAYNPDPFGTLATVWAQQGDEIVLVGGSILGGIALLLVAAQRLSRIPADPLTAGLARTLTLLESNHLAGSLTPQRALDVARRAVVDLQKEHEDAIRERTRAYEQALVRVNETHVEAIAAMRREANQVVVSAAKEASTAKSCAERALRRVADAEHQIRQLNHDLAVAHQQGVESAATVREQSAELDAFARAMNEATEGLARWQAAHQGLSDRYATLQEAHQEEQTALRALQATTAAMVTRCKTAKAEVEVVRLENQALKEANSTLEQRIRVAEKELARLRSVTLRELPVTIPDREGDLAPHMTALVAFIRGATLDSGAANGKRTTKPVLSAWRDIRRLFQVLKGVGVRVAVPAHHVPQWAAAAFPEGSRPASADMVEVPQVEPPLKKLALLLKESDIGASRGGER